MRCKSCAADTDIQILSVPPNLLKGVVSRIGLIRVVPLPETNFPASGLTVPIIACGVASEDYGKGDREFIGRDNIVCRSPVLGVVSKTQSVCDALHAERQHKRHQQSKDNFSRR